MPEKQHSFVSLIFLLTVTFFFVVASYNFLDKPIAWFVHTHHLRQLTVLRICADYPRTILQAFFFLCFFYIFVKSTLYPLRAVDRTLLGGAITAAVALFIKNNLKIIFGRYWPVTYICNNPSLIDNHAYGFHFYTKGPAYQSFPSGHSLFIAALASYFWHTYPRYRWLYLILVVMTVLGLLGMNYHFLSDIVAGIVMGYVIGKYMYVLLKRITYHPKHQ